MSLQNYNQKTVRVVFILAIISFLIIALIGTTVLNISLIIFLITGVVVFSIAAVVIRYSWQPQPHCPRCNMPVSVYTEFCRNCGLKLINKCPNCGFYIKTGQSFCNNCRKELQLLEGKKELLEYEIIQDGISKPEKPNFCSSCGASLKNAENLRYCEYCGSKIS